MVIILPKPNTSSDTQGEDLVTYGIMQPLVLENIAARQRFLIRTIKTDRALNATDAVAVLAPAAEKAQTVTHNLAAWRVRGLSPFTRQPLEQPHILMTKGKSKPLKTLNFEALDYNKPVTPQVREKLGKGRRLTSG